IHLMRLVCLSRKKQLRQKLKSCIILYNPYGRENTGFLHSSPEDERPHLENRNDLWQEINENGSNKGDTPQKHPSEED
ncbi:MAG: hypothetical protein ABIH23_11345, partial [bacterium]